MFSYVGCIYIYNCHILLMNWPLCGCTVMLFVFFWLKGYFIWRKYSLFFLFCLSFTWNIFFHPFTFRLHVSLKLKWVSWRCQIVGSPEQEPGSATTFTSLSFPHQRMTLPCCLGWGRVKGEMWNCLSSLLQCIFSYLFHPGSVRWPVLETPVAPSCWHHFNLL